MRYRFLLLAFLLAPTACGSQERASEPAYKPFQTGAGGSTNPQTDAGPNPGPGAECVTFTFTTLDNHGRYSPRNVSAVWVMDGNGVFFRTLEENGYIRQSHLVQWQTDTLGNKVDAVTGATNSAPRDHTVVWDCTGSDHQPVPDGSYVMKAEFTTSNTGGFFGGPAPLLEVPFDLGSGSGAIDVPDTQFFVGIHLMHAR